MERRDENGDLFIIIDGLKYKYPKPLNVERETVNNQKGNRY